MVPGPGTSSRVRSVRVATATFSTLAIRSLSPLNEARGDDTTGAPLCTAAPSDGANGPDVTGGDQQRSRAPGRGYGPGPGNPGSRSRSTQQDQLDPG